MTHPLINPADPPERQREKLLTIVEVLMRRVEQAADDSGASYAQFERAAMLEDQVRQRTRDLEQALDLLNQSNARLAEAGRETAAAQKNLANAIEAVQEGFALFGPDDVLVMCNSRFGMHMPDIREYLRPGLAFGDYVRLVSRSRYLRLPEDGDRGAWAAQRLRRHRERHLMFTIGMGPDRWVQVSEHRTPDGGTVILQTDVSDLIRAERAERGKLLDSQAQMVRATLDHIRQGVAIFDSAARLVGWNARLGEMLALGRGRLRLGMLFDDLAARLAGTTRLGQGMTLATLREWATAERGRAPLRFELRRGEVVLDAFAQEMPDTGFVISFSDVTAERSAIAALSRVNETLEARVRERTEELQAALADAERASAARSRFVAAASHDLLQPLSAAKLFVAAARDDSTPERTQATLTKAAAALDSVETILEALLDISRLESGKAAVTQRPVPLGPLLMRLADEFTHLAQARGLRLRLRPAEATVLSDAGYLRRILQNLIGNALRYTDAGGVLVGVRRAGAGALRVEVIDTGPGIPESEQRAVFREFHRLNARASATEGLGLGLAIVERAAKLLDHPLALQSVPGRGTRFSLTLPRAGPNTMRPTAAPDAADPAGPGAGFGSGHGAPPGGPAHPGPTRELLGLLVEDDTELRRALGLLLDGWGHSVLEAATHAEAMDLVSEIDIAPDFMLVDNRLGGGRSGLQVIEDMRLLHGPVPARIITADRSQGLRTAAARAGVAILYKPIDTGLLERFIASVDLDGGDPDSGDPGGRDPDRDDPRGGHAGG